MAVTGGAGFIGSHLCERLIRRGDEVFCIDNLSTGDARNLVSLDGHERFHFWRHDVTSGLPFPHPSVPSADSAPGGLDVVFHLASPASPPSYLRLPLETLAAGSVGTTKALELASRLGARFVLASTSEVYGDPDRHPQVEEDWGHVNPIGPRSVYDEAKRYAEAVTMAYHRSRGVAVGIARIFNVYGPRLRPSDGRAVPNFVMQALRGDPITLYGDGTQTRSFCYVDDLVGGLIALADTDVVGPINLGNPDERPVREVAELVVHLTESSSEIVTRPLPVDDPVRRRPDIARARELLGWEPTVPLAEGLARTVASFTAEPRPASLAGTLRDRPVRSASR
ncbi:MAG: SDR family oxidoreductase [Acidimicrobiaceae bacterium]|nr:SDR family oxidoreductase [Acidimicrobiaceae bacterium]